MDLRADNRGFGFSMRMSQGLHRTIMIILRIEKESPAFRDMKMQVGPIVTRFNTNSLCSLTFIYQSLCLSIRPSVHAFT